MRNRNPKRLQNKFRLRNCGAAIALCVAAHVHAAPGDPDESGIGGTGFQPPVPESFSQPVLPPATELPMLTPPVIPHTPEPPMVNIPATVPTDTTIVVPPPK